MRKGEKMLTTIKLGFIFMAVLLFTTNAELKTMNTASPRFEISFPASANKEPLDGRLLLLVSTNDKEEPRCKSAKT
jgi:hypothetical protein